MARTTQHGFSRWLQGLALGAAAMYMLDPEKGRRRRAVARDKLRRFGNDSMRLANQATRDVQHRLHGLNARIEQRFAPGGEADELRLIERVRSVLGRCVSHPRAVQVGARGNAIVLSGPILAHEVVDLLQAVHRVAGVDEVEDHLDVHTGDDHLPSLQGSGRQRGGGIPSWTPALRLAALVGGGALAVYGLGKRGATGLLLAGTGVSMAVRAVHQADGESCARRSPSAAFGEGAGAAGMRREQAGAAAASAPALGNDGTARGENPPGDRASGAELPPMTADTPRIGNDGTSSGPEPDPRRSAPGMQEPMPPMTSAAVPGDAIPRPPL